MSNSMHVPSQHLRLLSLDGGGVRGLVSLLILKRLMYLINPRQPPKPCDVFDMIAGTSTGGLIAIMLGRLRMDVSSCIEAYTDMSKDVFRISPWAKILGRTFFNFIGKATFDHRVLEGKVRGMVRDRLGDTDTALLEEDPACRMFVCASMLNTDTRRLRNYYSNIEEASNCRIWEAARATSAAPTFFEPITFKNGCTFRDGALRSNNPIFELIDEVQFAFPDQEVSCIVSIGTGIPDPIAITNSLPSIARASVKIMTDAESVAKLFEKTYCSPNAHYQGKYFRYNPRGIGNVRLDEWKKLDVMISNTESYLQDIAKTLRICATQLG
ncbi:FabD/lysophospholipase-like protein [Daldinia sp. FL1419]|nr:FabD/lysophospholipase-like protein [Daldinia sp. FL1419]